MGLMILKSAPPDEQKPSLQFHSPLNVESAAVYTAVVVLLLCLRAFLGDRFWPLALLNTFALYLTLTHPPYDIRTQRIDYVWHNDAFVAVEARVGPLAGSDHLPIAARLVLKTAGSP
jgi:hypothetical protein